MKRMLAVCGCVGLLSGAIARAEDDAVVAPVTDPSVNSPKEELRKKLFADAPDKPGCVAAPVDPHGGDAPDVALSATLKTLLEAMQAKKPDALAALFHKRLQIPATTLDEVLARVDNTYGAPIGVSVYRLLALNTVDGHATPVACAADRLTATPLYGYPLQFIAWIQILGQKELGRLAVSLVPADGRWNVGAFDVKQWTHDGKDYAAWTEAGKKAQAAGQKETAFAELDLAFKLTDAGPHLALDVADDVARARDAVMSRDDWTKAMRARLKGRDVVHVGSLFVIGGAGVLMRQRLKKEISVEAMRADCRAAAAALADQPGTAGLTGMRCSYLMPHESASQDGRLGGLYVAFAELKKPGK
jgi:hypothetical protein